MKVSSRRQRAALLAGCSLVAFASVPVWTVAAQTVSNQAATVASGATPPSDTSKPGPKASGKPHAAKTSTRKHHVTAKVRLAQATAPATPPVKGAGETQGPATDITDKQPTAQPETIVVQGYRKSLESALNRKRNSNLLIESVAPEDVGKLPDTNVAEALQRLPGVQITTAARKAKAPRC